MKQRLLLIVPLIVLLLSSCSVQQRAQRHLRRAIALDPTILSTLDTQVKLDTLIFHDTTVVVPAKDTSVVIPKKDTVLINDDRANISISKGKLLIKYKEIKIPIHDTTRITVTKKVPVTVVHERVYLRGFFWWAGIILLPLILLGIALLIFIKYR